MVGGIFAHSRKNREPKESCFLTKGVMFVGGVLVGLALFLEVIVAIITEE